MNRGPGEHLLVVMGVSGCGKSTVGRHLADRLGCDFIDGDDLHPESNVAAMAAGVALTDEDRWPWLARVGQWLGVRVGGGGVVACSALRKAYRDVLRETSGQDVVFVYLDLPQDVLTERVSSRAHFFPPRLLASQLATLEPLHADEAGLRVDGTLPVSQIVDQVVEHMGA